MGCVVGLAPPYTRQLQERGGIAGDLLQLGLIEPAATAKGNVHKRIRGDADAPHVSLDVLVTEMYRRYEAMVKWIWFAGNEVSWPFQEDAPRLQRWEDVDEKMIDRLRELIASPDFKSSELRSVFKEIDEGGVAKLVRDRIRGAIK